MVIIFDLLQLLVEEHQMLIFIYTVDTVQRILFVSDETTAAPFPPAQPNGGPLFISCPLRRLVAMQCAVHQ